MSAADGKELRDENAGGRLEQAVGWYLRVHGDDARVEELQALQDWLRSEPRNVLAYNQVAASWAAVGSHASAPEIMLGRRDALEDGRRAARKRWSGILGGARRANVLAIAAAIAGILFAVSAAYWFLASSRVYSTGLAERRTLTLEDGSVVALDAGSRIRVSYRDNERSIALERGQARFDVARDPTRPFRVRARDQVVIALGTQFNVELISQAVLVTMIEGHVAVTHAGARPRPVLSVAHERSAAVAGEVSTTPDADAAEPPPATGGREHPAAGIIELSAGEALRVAENGEAVITSKVDVARVVAWQSGRIFFDREPLASAVERINRYSRLRVEVDPAVADIGISGVFNAGDADAFIQSVSTYFPVAVRRTGDDEVYLVARR